MNKSKQLFYYAPIISALAIVLFINGYPFINTVIASFTDWNGLFQREFVGLSNYLKLFSEAKFWDLLCNTLTILLYLPFTMVLALITSCAVKDRPKLKHLFLYIVYVPQIISTVVVGKVFSIIFGFDGPINGIRAFLSLPLFDFLGNSRSAMIITIFSVIWFELGWQVLVIMGRLSSIEKNTSKLIAIDGLGFWKSTFFVYLPMIYDTFVYMGLISLFFAFSGLFPIIYVLTKGGPGYATTTIDYMIYTLSFGGSSSKLGEASALAIILLFIAIISVLLYLCIMKALRVILDLFYCTKLQKSEAFKRTTL